MHFAPLRPLPSVAFDVVLDKLAQPYWPINYQLPHTSHAQLTRLLITSSPRNTVACLLTIMFSAFSRAHAPLRPLRAAAIHAAKPRAAFRSSFRAYSTPPPAEKSNIGIYIGLAAVVVGGGASYFLWDAGKSATPNSAYVTLKANPTPMKEDFQKVCHFSGYNDKSLMVSQVYDKIAEILDDASDAGYDGNYLLSISSARVEAVNRWFIWSRSSPVGLAFIGYIRQGHPDRRQVSAFSWICFLFLMFA